MTIAGLGCYPCGTYNKCDECADCGRVVHIGDYPLCPHGKPHRSKGFEAFWDDNLQAQINGFGDLNRQFKPRWENDHIVQIEPREKPASYYRELNDRRRERNRR